MSYTVLVTADLHLSNSLPHSRLQSKNRRGVTDRLADQLRVIDRIKSIVSEMKADLIIILGDIFDRRLVDAITLSAGVEAIRELSTVAPVWLLPGNHDANSARGDRFLIEAFSEMRFPNVTYLGGHSGISAPGYEGLVFYPVSWSPIGEARERIQEARYSRDTASRSILLLHQGVNGCKDGGWVCDGELDPKEVCDGFDLVISGHFHEPQNFGDCGYYVGAPMQFDFRDADSSARSVMLITFSSAPNPLIKRLNITSPRFFVRRWSDLSRAKLLPRGVKRGDYLRIDVRATREDFAAMRSEVDSYIEQLRDSGVNAMGAKHELISDTESRIVIDSDSSVASNFEMVIDRYIALANLGSLDCNRLSAIGKEILRETLANGHS